MSHSGQQSANDLLVRSWLSSEARTAGAQRPSNAGPGFIGTETMHGGMQANHHQEGWAQGGANLGEGHDRVEQQEMVEDEAEDIQYNLRPRSVRHRKAVEVEGREAEDTSDGDNYSDDMAPLPDSPRKGKRKVGRPIAYQGDINSPHLTEAERRRMKRRVDNRESARRVRNKRHSFLLEISNKITAMKSSNASLKAQIAQDHDMSCKMKTEIAEARAQFAQAEQDGARLRNEIGMLRSHFMGPTPSTGNLALQPPTCHQQQASQMPTPALALSLSRLNTLSLPGAPSLSLSLFGSRELPSLSMLASQPSKELPFSEFVQMHRQNSQRPLPDLGSLGEIKALTGLDPLAMGAQKQPQTLHTSE